MATSETQIANMALRFLGHGKPIGSMDEASDEARACKAFYETVRDEALRDLKPQWAKKIVALGLLEEDPNSEWDYSYMYPADCLDFIRILSGTRNDHRQSRVPYRFASGDNGTLIFTDKEDAEAEYLRRVTTVLRYPPDFVVLIAYRLAEFVAPSVAGTGAAKLVAQMHSLYEVQKAKAGANLGNEEQPEERPDSEFTRARD